MTAVPICLGCDDRDTPGRPLEGHHLPDCPYWISLPTKLTKLSEIGLAPEGDDSAVAPMEIVARVFERPFQLEAHVEVAALAPPRGSRQGRNLPIGQYGVAVANKVTPEMLLAIVANIIAQAPTAAAAVAQIREEVAGWTFETSTGVRG